MPLKDPFDTQMHVNALVLIDTAKSNILSSADFWQWDLNLLFFLLLVYIFMNESCSQTERNRLCKWSNSQACIFSWTGGIHQVEMSDLQQVCAA